MATQKQAFYNPVLSEPLIRHYERAEGVPPWRDLAPTGYEIASVAGGLSEVCPPYNISLE